MLTTPFARCCLRWQQWWRTASRLSSATLAAIALAGPAIAQTVLPAETARERAAALPDWTLDGDTLVWERTFADFPAAIAFANCLVEPAERANHHPDLAIAYNRVTLRLTTHDAGGLTERDFDLARTLSALDCPAAD